MSKKAQAAIELVIFGAILIFVLGTIVRSATGNGYSQNQNFKAMRMAMLASWQGSEANPGQQAQNIARNSASVLFVEDRLSPDFNKYGDLDRNPFIAQGSGTFSYNLFYPVSQGEVGANLPIMDVWINGMHFPFTIASYVVNNTITRSMACSSDCQASTPQQLQCLQNQINRNKREWVGGTVNESQFDNIVSPPVAVAGCPITTAPVPVDVNIECDAWAIFNELANEGLIALVGGSMPPQQGATVNSSTLSSTFIAWLEATFPGTGQAQVNQIQSIFQSNQYGGYKLFYTMVPNAISGANGTSSSSGTPQFSSTPPASCSGTNNALCASLTLLDANGHSFTNTNGDMQYDLLRNGDYNSVEQQFPYISSCSPTSSGIYPQNMRCYIAWQWAAAAGKTAKSIGLDPNSNQYPQYDIDGRLKEVTIYAISQTPNGAPTVTYEDPNGGDIDGSWDSNSCGPKPGLQNGSEIFTFTQNGTYLQIKEGKLYNPETDQFVRSANKRDTIDLIQREIQLSNDTGRFCNGTSETPPPCVARCLLSTGNCTPSQMTGSCQAQPGETTTPVPNPVEVCIPAKSGGNCFTGSNSNGQIIAQTCYDETGNMIFVRSRLLDRRGHFWMTDASGQLQVH